MLHRNKFTVTKNHHDYLLYFIQIYQDAYYLYIAPMYNI